MLFQCCGSETQVSDPISDPATNKVRKSLGFFRIRNTVISCRYYFLGCAHGSGTNHCGSHWQPLQDRLQETARPSNGGTFREPWKTLAVCKVELSGICSPRCMNCFSWTSPYLIHCLRHYYSVCCFFWRYVQIFSIFNFRYWISAPYHTILDFFVSPHPRYGRWSRRYNSRLFC